MDKPEADHCPVLRQEALELLAIDSNGAYVDATVGAGGHAVGIVARLDRGRLVALDLDPHAAQAARERLGHSPVQVDVVHADYREIEHVLRDLGIDRVDGVLFDLGLSSLQLADRSRGFGFQEDAPLDMRFDPAQELTAWQIINRYPEDKLVQVFRDYGQERWARRIAAEIVEARRQAPIETGAELATLIMDAVPKPAQRGFFQGRDVHPATRVFQALRIEVNHELDNVRAGLEAAFDVLAPGGRLVVIAYHSLEDRIVKRFMKEKESDCVCPPDLPVCRCEKTRQAEIVAKLTPSATEIERNPRARSARLRALEKI